MKAEATLASVARENAAFDPIVETVRQAGGHLQHRKVNKSHGGMVLTIAIRYLIDDLCTDDKFSRERFP
jgi:hypothetical protein